MILMYRINDVYFGFILVFKCYVAYVFMCILQKLIAVVLLKDCIYLTNPTANMNQASISTVQSSNIISGSKLDAVVDALRQIAGKLDRIASTVATFAQQMQGEISQTKAMSPLRSQNWRIMDMPPQRKISSLASRGSVRDHNRCISAIKATLKTCRNFAVVQTCQFEVRSIIGNMRLKNKMNMMGWMKKNGVTITQAPGEEVEVRRLQVAGNISALLDSCQIQMDTIVRSEDYYHTKNLKLFQLHDLIFSIQEIAAKEDLKDLRHRAILMMHDCSTHLTYFINRRYNTN